MIAAEPAPRQVRITQRGKMWQKPNTRPMRFTATQFLAVERIAFSWRAHFPLLGPLALHVVDGYADGDGALEVRLLGVPLQRQRGHETVVGEALRYLAELPFVPQAIARNSELEWRELDERRAEVTALVAGEHVAVELAFNDAREIVGTSSQDRRLRVANEWRPTPWGGRFADYKTFDGIRIPTSAEAYWDFPEARYVYWRAIVTSAEFLDEPFQAQA